MPPVRGLNLAIKERFGAFLCVLLIVAGAIFCLIYLIGAGILPFH